MKNSLPYIIVATLCIFSGCGRVPAGIEYIIVSKNSFDSITHNMRLNVDSVRIADHDKIAEIAGAINSSHAEPAKFLAEYDVALHYKDSVIRVTAIGNYFTINGRSYKSDKDLADILNHSGWQK